MPQSNTMVRGAQSNSPTLEPGHPNVNGQKEPVKKQQRERTGSLYVVVEDMHSAVPIQDAIIKVMRRGTEGEVVAETKTNKKGEGKFERLTASEELEAPNHLYHFTVEAPSYESKEIEDVEIIPEETTNKNVRLERQQAQENMDAEKTGKIRIRVRQAEGRNPVYNASVKIYSGMQNGTMSNEVRTDESGNTPVMEFSTVTSTGEGYRIAVSADGYYTQELRNVDIVPGEMVVENVYLIPLQANKDMLHSMETLPPSTDSTVENEEEPQIETNVSNNNASLPIEELEPQVGRLRVDVISILRNRPVVGATVRIYYVGQTGTPLQEVVTDSIGRTEELVLEAPNIEYSLEPTAEQPYALYDLLVEAPGYESVEINSMEILPAILAIQNISLMPLADAQGESSILYVIPPHTLFGDYPPKIAETEIKPVGQTGEIVLSKVVVPEYVVVHDGPPSDTSAQNYYVKYRDYIKNVASSEIYATWPEATIIANVLCIQSFCLNRVYTEWYRNRGYTFTITNSTAYDQKYIPGRNIFDSISEIVDQVFANYLARPDVAQPIFTQFCDGRKVSCPNWLSQWGSKSLGDQGYSAIEILRYYYGDDMYIATAEEVSGVPASWPGVDLEVGSRSDAVRQVQRQLNIISNGYPLIPKISQDGIYGERTADAVRVFQEVFGLPATGVVDFPTWYKISEIYVGVSRIAELS